MATLLNLHDAQAYLQRKRSTSPNSDYSRIDSDLAALQKAEVVLKRLSKEVYDQSETGRLLRRVQHEHAHAHN
jgi:hypothetical protein